MPVPVSWWLILYDDYARCCHWGDRVKNIQDLSVLFVTILHEFVLFSSERHNLCQKPKEAPEQLHCKVIIQQRFTSQGIPLGEWGETVKWTEQGKE